MSLTPIVLYPLTLPGLLDYILKSQSSTSSTTLIICSSRHVFLDHLSRSLHDDEPGEHQSNLQNLLAPTLYNLFTTQHVKLAFCASVQTLLAYLTAHGRSGTEHLDTIAERPRLVLVNPLALHAATPSFSAQGLSRTFAAATETASRIKAELWIVECQMEQRASDRHDEEDVEMEGETNDLESVDLQDPWEHEVSILNVSARRFGSGTDGRVWAGRTVKVRSIAARWFRFHELDKNQIHKGPG